MEIQISFSEQPSVQESFRIENLLGEGKFQVYTVYSEQQQTKYALKVFPSNLLGKFCYQTEQVLSHLQHPNIIKNIPVICDNEGFNCLLTEFAQYGDFLNLTMKGIFHSEALIRTYFHQLIEGIEYLHTQGVAHLDLKLDNLVLGSDFKLKIIDFDQAQLIEDKKLNCGGTIHYRPPEVIDNKCKNLAAVDVYSAGIILYALIANEFPFYEVTDSKGIRLQHFSTFVKDKTKFWNMKTSRQQDKTAFSEDLIELLNGMFEYDVKKRFNLQDIKQSKWYQGPVIKEERLDTQLQTILDSFVIN
jgi:serine/threonine protein kinase